MEKAVDGSSRILTGGQVSLSRLDFFASAKKSACLIVSMKDLCEYCYRIFRRAWRECIQARYRRCCLNTGCDRFARFYVTLNQVERGEELLAAQEEAR